MNIRTRVALATAALLLFSSSALHAHPRLRRSEPMAGEVLHFSPASIALYFSEAPELAMTTLSLHGPVGLVTLTQLATDPLDRNKLTAAVPRNLPAGVYTVTWRTAASDGHPVKGTFDFTITESSPSAVPTKPALPATESPAASTSTTDASVQSPFHVLLRGVAFVSLIAAIGAVAFRTSVLPRVSDLDAATRIEMMKRCALVGVLSTAALLLLAPLRLQLQVAMMPEHIASGRIQTLTMHTRWGNAWLMSTAGSILALIGFVCARLRLPVGWAIAAGGAAVLALGAALSGHAGASPRWTETAVVIDAVHIIGASGWLGSLFCVVSAGLPASRNSARGADTLAKLVNAFSPMALAFAGLVVLSGVMSAWLRLGAFNELWSSQYGKVLLLKLLALTAVFGTAGYNWRRVKPALGGEAATARFRWSARAELAIGVLVIFITAVLVATPPPTDGL